MLTRILHHLKQGTLLAAISRKVRGRRSREANPDQYRGDVARNYLNIRLKQEMWHREQAVVAELLAAVPDGSRVLDVAFGTGRFVGMYARKNMSVYGIDISEDMLALARAELGHAYDQCHIQLGSADALPYLPDQFDLVMCFRFFGLIPLTMARRVLTEIHRVARRHVIIRVPVRKDAEAPVKSADDARPLQGRLYDHEVVDLFGAYGFAVLERRSLGDEGRAEFIVYVLEKTDTLQSGGEYPAKILRNGTLCKATPRHPDRVSD